MKTKIWVKVLSIILVGIMGLGSATVAIALLLEMFAK